MTELVFYQGGGFRVTDALLVTPRKTYALGKVEYVSVTRPLLFFAACPALGVIGAALAFQHYLFWGEIVTLVTLSVLASAAACLFGTLRIHSLALRDDEVAQSFGPIGRLREVRRAVEKAMVVRAGAEDVR